MNDEPACIPTPVRPYLICRWLTWLIVSAVLGAGCFPLQSLAVFSPSPEPLPLVLLDWENDITPEILQGFTAETGIKVELRYYYSAEEAYRRILEGEACDLAIVDNDKVPGLIRAERLLPLDLTQVPNFRHINPAFRDLVIDPSNRYSIPNAWGTSGIVYRESGVFSPPRRWADLWNKDYAGRVFLWDHPRTVIGLTLKALGYSANSEDLQALNLAAAKLHQWQTLPPAPYEPEALAEAFRSGQAQVAVAWVGDYLLARREIPDLVYLLPAEGSILWMNHFVLPRAARSPEAAQRLLDYLLRPEVAAQITTQSLWATANETSWAMTALEPQVRALVFPSTEALENAELTLPLSPEAEMTYNRIWEQFVRLRSSSRETYPSPTP
ncbi:MAG: spermidine/putrescine ABC transporter substrate-binding protein [Thermanaerothrix sp.]|nr:spermidine/putrescine ABC transporter substrate-binding protein [Thermanaerothrix sp.]